MKPWKRREHTRRFWTGWLTGAAVLVAAALGLSFRTPAAPLPDRVDFNFHIRPLLSDRCFACHGPDDKARKGKLDLHTRAGALRGGSSGEAALKPGEPDASELVKRLLTTDPDEAMPPRESKLPPLTPDEVALVKRWIEQGAEFKEHWAFLPPQHPDVPEVRAPGATLRNDIDRFVLAQLEREQLTPQPEAARSTLIRRVALDLTGLPSTPEEIAAFEGDTSPQAYERMVDRYLGSPHYGERMAQEWMDLARFADTFGYQADVDVDLSPWRDWVIRALNDNLSWDRFITWQVAGDLLPEATADQRLATAFNRLHRQTNEGGSIDEEFRVEYVSDRVHTMGTAFLGLTLECSRCHDHKYDPIPQSDYYRLSAYFNSIDESGLYSHFTRAMPTPAMFLWEGDAEAKHRAAEQALREAEAAAATAQRDARARARDWAAGRPRIEPPAPVAQLPFDSISENRTPDLRSTNAVALHDGPVLVAGRDGQAMQFSGDNSATLPQAGRFSRTDPFSFSFWIRPTLKQDRAVVFHMSRAWTDSGSRGYEFVLDHGRPWFALIHFWPGNAIAVRAKDALPENTWTHFAVTYDGSSRASGIRLFQDGRALEVEVVRDLLYKDIQHRAEWGDADAGGVGLALAGRFRDNGFKKGELDEFRVYDTQLTSLEVAHLSGADPATRPASEWEEHSVLRQEERVREALAALRERRREENALVTPVREIMVMKEMPEKRRTYVLRRGAYDARGDEVEAGVLEKIFPAPANLPRNRLGLAQWLTDPQHPLTARVAVNRIWKLHFGRGLVATTWDFGAQGTLPSHPELLDWLATEFVRSGWDRKAMHKRILMSATYRQSSRAPAALAARDPENRLLARGPKHRLDAEQIRDSALAASGLLVPVVGGRSVKPYQPAGVWEDAGTGKSYSQDKGEKLYRRSLYTFWRRTAPPPSMLTFDATSREVCTSKREVTTTPLQSLVLLNDPQFLEAARVLGESLWKRHPDDRRALVEGAFLRLTGRRPEAREVDVLTRLHSEQRRYFEAHPDAARDYLALGEKPRDETVPVVDLAAATVLTSTLMNHDEFVMKR